MGSRRRLERHQRRMAKLNRPPIVHHPDCPNAQPNGDDPFFGHIDALIDVHHEAGTPAHTVLAGLAEHITRTALECGIPRDDLLERIGLTYDEMAVLLTELEHAAAAEGALPVNQRGEHCHPRDHEKSRGRG